MQIKKNIFIFSVLALTLTAIIFLTACQKQKPTGQFNKIVFVTIDTLRADHLKHYGYPRETSPFLSKLFENGTMFSNAFSASSHTTPSHTTMFTSLFPYEHNVLRNHDTIDSKIFSLHNILNEQGYEQGIFPATRFLEGKVGFPMLPEEFQLEQAKINSKFWYRMAKPNIDQVVNWLDKKNNPEKYFLWVHLYDVHAWMKEDSQTLPSEYLELFPKAGTPEAESLVDFVIEKHNIPLSFYNNNRAEYYEAMTRYDARLRYVDDQLKRLYDHIKSKGDDDVLWIITSDHGEGMGNHNYAGHGEFLYQEQLHIPLVFYSDRGTIKSQKIEDIVRTVDFLPTLMDLTAYQPNPDLRIQGLSLKPLIDSGKWGDKKVVYSFAERRPKDDAKLRRFWEEGEIFAVHDLEEKYIYHSETDDEFYDLKKDPFEERNLGDQYNSLNPMFKNKVDELINFYARGGRKMGEQKLDQKEIDELKTLGYM